MKKSLVLLLLVVCFSLLFMAYRHKMLLLIKLIRKSTIKKLNQLMVDYYVFPEVAKKTEKHLNQLLVKGHFEKFEDLDGFAKELTAQVQAINKDKHMRIRPRSVGQAPPNSIDRVFEEHLQYKMRSRFYGAGFMEAKRLEGNIGYIDLRGFANVSSGGPVADHYMALICRIRCHYHRLT